MKNLAFISFLCLFASCTVWGQTGKDVLLKEAEEKLKTTRGSISQILTDKKYDALHPETAFRDLIAKYARAETISIATDTIPGRKIKVIGTVKNEEGKAVVNALVYLYHTDSRGWYAANSPHVNMNAGDMLHARLFGYVRTDKDGKFELHTIKPSGYPQSDLPAHIHVHVTADGYNNFVNEFLFDDDERLVGKIREDATRNQFMISRPQKTTTPFAQQFSYLMTLKKL